MYGRKFLLRKNHRVLTTLFSSSKTGKRPLRCLYRRSDRLFQYTFEIEYKCGASNQVADYLSRIQHVDCNSVNEEMKHNINMYVSAVFSGSLISVISMRELANNIDNNEVLSVLKSYVING